MQVGPQLNLVYLINMENLRELLLTRHSIRRYTDKPIDAEHVKTILEAGLLAPSSKNARSFSFVAVEDPAVLARLSECKPAYAASVKGARLAIVVCANPEKSEAYIEDATVAAILMHMQAHDLGIGSCWVQVRGRFAADGEPSENIVREILEIPENIMVECIMTFGYPDEQRKPVNPEKLLWEKVHIGTWKETEL